MVSLWEHEYDQHLKTDSRITIFCERFGFSGSFESQGSFVRGTHECHSFVLVDMRYVDVCSLFPYVIPPGNCITPCSLIGPEESYYFPYAVPVPRSVPLSKLPLRPWRCTAPFLGNLDNHGVAQNFGLLVYRLDKIHEIWHFPKQVVTFFGATSILFWKKEASGFPLNCQTEGQNQSYIQDTFIREKIMLDLRTLGKIPY